jgi:Na+/pantothenate symporter
MMQKNISVKKLGDSQKNVITLAIVLVSVLVLFLFLGGLLYMFAQSKGALYQEVMVNGKGVHQLVLDHKNIIGDKIFPSVVMNYLPPALGILFIIALISALFPSADGALTALTSSFCIDILGLQQKTSWSEQYKKKIRLAVHFSFALIFLICIMIFYKINDNSVIDIILDLAGYTYGPLLGLFAFGIFTQRSLPNHASITLICLLAPLLSYILSKNAASWFNNYQIGIELLIINGLFTFIGLFFISTGKKP